METEKIVQLDPKNVVAEGNARFGLKKTAIDSLAQDIKETGAVLQPVEVAPTDKPGVYRLIYGFIRHAAVKQLNDEGAGMTLPALVRETADDLGRLKHQVSENVKRESMSPMDMAVAIKRFLDLGVSRTDIRNVFARPGGRKGLTLQPVSNAYLNMMTSFLDLPKSVQEKIHDGRVGVAAGYELSKVTPEKRQAILEKAEADRLAAIERDEREEERYEAAQAKVRKLADEAKQVELDMGNAKLEVETVKKVVEDLHATAAQKYEALMASRKGTKKEQQQAAEEKAAVEARVKEAERKLLSAEKTVVSLDNKAKKLTETTEETNKRLAEVRKITAAKGKPKSKAVGPSDVRKAAQAEGEGAALKRLTAAEMREVIDTISRPGAYGQVAEIGKALLRCFNSQTTTKQLYNELATLTGERVATDKTSKELPKRAKVA